MVEKEVMEGQANLVVGLLPAKVDAGWYHDHVHRWMHWVRRCRIHFETPSGKTSSNTKGSLLVAWTFGWAVAEAMRAGI